MKKIITLVALTTLVASFSTASNVQINCSGVDGAGKTIQIGYGDITATGFGDAYGVLAAKTDSGFNTFDVRARLTGREGKVENEEIGFNKDLYIEGNDVFLNLDKTGRQQYQGSICGPHNNIKIAGVLFGQNDCIDLVCNSKGLSTLK